MLHVLEQLPGICIQAAAIVLQLAESVVQSTLHLETLLDLKGKSCEMYNVLSKGLILLRIFQRVRQATS